MAKYFFVVLMMVIDVITLSHGIPIMNEQMSDISAKLKDRRNYEAERDGAFDFPNYDYDNLDNDAIYDFGETFPDSKNSLGVDKRYSDALATDMRSRLERMKILKARNKFLQMIMGKRTSSEDSLSHLVGMLRQKEDEKNDGVEMALEELRFLNMFPRGGEMLEDGTTAPYRTKRHDEGAYMRRTGILSRLKAAAKRRRMFKSYLKRKFDTPDFLREMIKRAQ